MGAVRSLEMTGASRATPETVAERVLEVVRARPHALTATYRLQLHAGFNFRDAAAVVPYLQRLGISHVYCSPCFRARTGSSHGYDICDHSQVNPELGGEDAYQEYLAALRDSSIGQIIDVVPNHMAASLQNPWWHDVLENGPASPYSQFFDIDWRPAKRELANKVLLPTLDQQYGEVLENGQIRLEYQEGAFCARFYEHAFPLGPKTIVPVLSHQLDELRAELGESEAMTEFESILTALDNLPPQDARDAAAVRVRHREKEIIKRRLRELTESSPAVRRHIERSVVYYNGNCERPESFDPLDQLLAAQSYRICHWRGASDEINYRRFFDVNDLAAICMETPEVFQRTHGLVRQLLADRSVDGLRIDHVDGLYDPERYLWRLQWAYLADLGERAWKELASPLPGDSSDTTGGAVPEWGQLAVEVLRRCCTQLGLRQPELDDLRAFFPPDWQTPIGDAVADLAPPERQSNPPLFVLVEKILGPDEPLPESWPVAGTSGYDFLNSLNGLTIVSQGYSDLIRMYSRFIGSAADLREIEHDCKVLILRVAMASELQMLAHRLNRISEQHRRSRDFTLNNLRVAIREVLACFPVYRVYPKNQGISERDRKFVDLAVARARRRNPAFDPAVFEFLRSVLLLQHPPGLSADQIGEREVFTGKFQQVTSPVMAKGVEDTAFYVYVPLASAVEVGSNPRWPITNVGDFHEGNRLRNRNYPRAMLATSTHDTKRSEDVRARLNVLTEIARDWRTAVNRFARSNKRWRHEVDGEPAPSRNDEYLFYQSLLGIWPVHPPTDVGREALVQRLQVYMEKATREAKQRTSWVSINQAYDSAVRDFVARTMRPEPNNRFLRELTALHSRIVTAGLFNSLFQVVLKLLSPGVPDIYQGQELWDFSLVDPDNRRPVDYSLRARLLDELDEWERVPDPAWKTCLTGLVRNPGDPRLKLLVTRKLLALRQTWPELFVRGEYVPVEVVGPLAQHVVAFGWRSAERQPLEVLAVVPRHVQALLNHPGGDATAPLFEPGTWDGTELILPEGRSGRMTDLFTRQPVSLEGRRQPVEPLLVSFPASVLVRGALSGES